MITIQLAAYNGAPYISEQIDSILAQTVRDFTLLIRDDCSADETASIVEDYAGRYPGRIIAEHNAVNSKSAKNNFFNMMAETRDDYLMLCDQDDVWLPDKIEKSLAKMREMEALYGADTPILVHTDLTVADKSLNVISPSLEHFMDADFTRTALNNLIIQNTVTGCTALYNRALAVILDRQPPYAVIHDWWLALVAALFGKIGYLPEPTVLYRQHGGNEIGAKNARGLRYKIDKALYNKQIKESIDQTYIQARSLLELYEDRLDPERVLFLKNYCAIPYLGKLGRCKAVCDLNVFKYGLMRNVAYFLYI